MSEKLDGVRAIWNGENFVSRNGNIFPAPKELCDTMPKGVILDGEIFAGRGEFQKTISLIKKSDWSTLQFLIFDLVNNEPTEERQATLKGVALPSFCELVEQVECEDFAHLDAFELDILELGGEGVILRKACSLYQHKRSSDLLKVKRFSSAEAVVTGYEAGKGKHDGRTGALRVKFGKVSFKVGSGLTNEQREHPPEIGETITFSYFGLTDAGKPRHPSFTCARNYE